MNPDKKNLRDVRLSYFKNNTYEKNKRKNSERLQRRRIYGYDEDIDGSDPNDSLNNSSNSKNNKKNKNGNENFGIYENNNTSDTDNTDHEYYEEKYEHNENYENDVENLNLNPDNEYDAYNNSNNDNNINNNFNDRNNRSFNRNYYNGNNYYNNNRKNNDILYRIKDFLKSIYRGNEAILAILLIFIIIYYSRKCYLFDTIKRIVHTKIKDKESVVNTIILINVMVYLLWVFAHYLERNGPPQVRLLQFLQNNFTSSWTNTIQQKRYWTLLTDSFSHENLGHLTGNMFTLYSFSFMVIDAIGINYFIIFYLLSGIGSSLAHVFFNHYIVPILIRIRYRYQRQRQDGRRQQSLLDIIYKFLFTVDTHVFHYDYDMEASLGASGAITGIEMILTCLYPMEYITFYDIDLPSWIWMALFIVQDILSSVSLNNRTVDTIGHVGGGIVGFLCFFIWMKFKTKRTSTHRIFSKPSINYGVRGGVDRKIFQNYNKIIRKKNRRRNRY